jgi:hypothetical protein
MGGYLRNEWLFEGPVSHPCQPSFPTILANHPCQPSLPTILVSHPHQKNKKYFV